MKEIIKKTLPPGLLDWYYRAIEWFAGLVFDFPGKKLKIIGVTGTKGKSTTVFLITRIFEEAGLRVAASSSIEFRINKKSAANTLKMGLLSRRALQQFLSEALHAKAEYAIIECTSEGLAQHRVDFVHFVGAVFTNIAPEHIESHGSYERYRQAKRHLFELLHKDGVAIINKDDKEGAFMARATRAKVIYYSLKNEEDIDTPLIGEFNQYNARAASVLCKSLGVSDEVIRRTLAHIKTIPGRLEEIKEGQDFRVFVDYAHNPSSLEAASRALFQLKTKDSKLILITGAQGGGRDKWKRPEMGKIAATYGDTIIITNEDPYKEDPKKIIDDVYQGALKAKDAKLKTIMKIIDRKKAIEKALRIAGGDDIILFTGKGSETVMETVNGKIPWNEREIVREELKKLISNH